jgi:hypothetical protein
MEHSLESWSWPSQLTARLRKKLCVIVFNIVIVKSTVPKPVGQFHSVDEFVAAVNSLIVLNVVCMCVIYCSQCDS